MAASWEGYAGHQSQKVVSNYGMPRKRGKKEVKKRMLFNKEHTGVGI